jgi:hypothetical protein
VRTVFELGRKIGERRAREQWWLGARAKVVGADLLRGQHFDPKVGRISLRAYALERWFPSQVHLRPNTVDQYRSHLHTHIVPLLGERQLGALRRTDMKAFVAAVSARLAPATTTTVYAVLRSMMQSAVDDGLIPGNPCSRVPLPRIDPRVLEPLTADQVSALAAAITPRYEGNGVAGRRQRRRRRHGRRSSPGRPTARRRRLADPRGSARTR